MGLFDALKGEAQRNFIARSDAAKNDIIYAYPERNVRMMTQLTVGADEVAIFVKDGQVQGKLGPGRHTLEAQNIPFLGNGLAVLVSARVGEARLAQQLSALVVLPIMALVGGQLAGWIRAGTGYYAVQGAVVLVLDILLVRASVRLFDRERLVSRWT